MVSAVKVWSATAVPPPDGALMRPASRSANITVTMKLATTRLSTTASASVSQRAVRGRRLKLTAPPNSQRLKSLRAFLMPFTPPRTRNEITSRMLTWPSVIDAQ